MVADPRSDTFASTRRHCVKKKEREMKGKSRTIYTNLEAMPKLLRPKQESAAQTDYNYSYNTTLYILTKQDSAVTWFSHDLHSNHNSQTPNLSTSLKPPPGRYPSRLGVAIVSRLHGQPLTFKRILQLMEPGLLTLPHYNLVKNTRF